MQMPLEIAFRNVDPVDWARKEIEARVEKLQSIYSRLIGARVRIDQRVKAQGGGSTPPVVRIELSVPGHRDIVIAHEPEHLTRKFQAPDLRRAISESFRLAERRLRSFKERQQGRVKHHVAGADQQFMGQVAELHADSDHGFLMNKDGSLLYFHRDSLMNGDFRQLKRGDTVHYVEEASVIGRAASKVRMMNGAST